MTQIRPTSGPGQESGRAAQLDSDGDFSDEQLLLTTVQAARVLAIGRTTIYQLIKDGELHPVHIARSCRISRAELKRYVNRLEAANSAGATR